tara:strand:+ start:701 stop:1753 length:1053 start_codon:yes stop_codon:yes gene_type:complete
MKKKALVIGVTGQDGSYLAELLLKKGYTVHGLVRRSSIPNTGRIDHLLSISNKETTANNLIREYGDVTDSSQMQSLISKIMPDEVYNLAAQSHVRVSFEVPEYTYNVVGLGPIRILEALKNIKKDTKYLQASSSEMFGNSRDSIQNEETVFKPESPYASAKVLGFHTTANYRDNFGMFASNSIMFNHESPRRGINFVTRKIVRGLCEIKLRKRNILYLGNLDAKRDWGYAKEYVEVFWKILQHEKPDDFVVATGKSISVRYFAELVAQELGMNIAWKGKNEREIGVDLIRRKKIIAIDPIFYRPNDVQFLLGDNSKIKKILNWKPKTTIEKLVKIMVKSELRLLNSKDTY